MKSLCAIRTNKWTTEEERLMAILKPVFGDDLVVVFHNRNEDIVPPIPVVDLTTEWVENQDLRMTKDWGWRCGDYFYYALRQAHPDFDNYWLLEPDVFFSGDAQGFFDKFTQVNADLLGVNPVEFGTSPHRFSASLGNLDVWRAVFALTRLSGRAIDYLLPRRVANGKLDVGTNKLANDELFTFSYVHANQALSIDNLTKYAPSWFEGARVESNPDFLLDAIINEPSLQNKVFHPVKSRDQYKAALASRMMGNLGFLKRMPESIVHLTDAEVEEIANMSRDQILGKMQRIIRRSRKSI